MILNLGCGTEKITGAINVDMNPDNRPDVLFDIREPFPYSNDTCDKVFFFHCIEHIEKRYHVRILQEIWRVLKPGGQLVISYPEFSSIIEHWKRDTNSKRDFWEATIFGRQLYPGDYHVCAMDTLSLVNILIGVGFECMHAPEPLCHYNTVVNCTKVDKPKNYETVLRDAIFK